MRVEVRDYKRKHLALPNTELLMSKDGAARLATLCMFANRLRYCGLLHGGEPGCGEPAEVSNRNGDSPLRIMTEMVVNLL